MVFFSRFLTHLLARIDNKEKNFGNQKDFKIRQAQSLRGGTLLDPAGGRGGDPVLLILQTGSFLVKDGRKTGAFFSKNTGVRRAKRRAKFKFLYKKARKFDSRHFNDKSA